MTLRFIHLEDDPNDRELVAEMLRSELDECEIIQVASRDDFQQALDSRPDLILSDYSLPGFGGDAAHALAAARWPDVPFVFVSGSIGEDRAVERLKDGATDYVLKDRLDKLGTAVHRALREARDRQGRMEAEAALRKLNAELEQRVADRTRELQIANRALLNAQREADRANRAKSDFLSRMSHDLRTPLNAVLGFAQLLQLDPLTPSQEESVAHILRGGQHLLNMIDEILDIARIETGHLTLSCEPVAVSDVLAESVALIRPSASKAGITIVCDAPEDAHAFVDRQRLSQILLNLLSNAVKYNVEQGRIEVAARVEGGEVRIDVADTGIGIPAEKLSLLFTPFERLGAELTSVEGTGLGLALAKRLAEEMKGSLGVTSAAGGGTTFELRLPASAPVSLASDDATRDQQLPIIADYSGTILYVEDNPSNVVLMSRVLSRRPSVTLRHAPNGESALRAVKTELPDLILLDLHLSDIPGIDVLGRLRNDPATQSVPIIVLSADATTGSRSGLIAAGAIAYLTKPFNVAELLRQIDRVMGQQR